MISLAEKLSPRMRRLIADADYIKKTFSDFPLIRLVETQGNPPDLYRIEYRIKGLMKNSQNKIVVRDQHLLEIKLTRDYPRERPLCKMLTPIFHPNIEPSVICIGDHWTAGERLVSLIIRIAEMIAYQSYNIKSPLDGEAAMWAHLNEKHLPIDNRDMNPPEKI
ncbi:MAG: hypothetical protein HUU50_04940 [Candidatus Brocadiae bacterium]|nr:hypothetical protein [Candidatus Brocadiia bacterium]